MNMLPKIIKKGALGKNQEQHFDYPTISWDELAKNKEERLELLLNESADTNESIDNSKPQNKKNNISSVENQVEEKHAITPTVDLDFIKKEAEKILENANVRKEEIEKQAYEQGFSSGKAIGLEEGKSKYNEALSKIGNSINSLLNVKNELIREYEPEIIKLAISIAEKIVKREVTIKSDHIVEIVSSLVNQLKDKSKVIIKLSPEDFEDLKNSEKLGKLKYISTNFEIIEDPTLSKGDVMVDTSFGVIDASINSQLKRIEEELV